MLLQFFKDTHRVCQDLLFEICITTTVSGTPSNISTTNLNSSARISWSGTPPLANVRSYTREQKLLLSGGRQQNDPAIPVMLYHGEQDITNRPPTSITPLRPTSEPPQNWVFSKMKKKRKKKTLQQIQIVV